MHACVSRDGHRNNCPLQVHMPLVGDVEGKMDLHCLQVHFERLVVELILSIM